MRSLSLSALIAVAAFALGVAATGHLPGVASAADAKPAGLDWKSDGKSLILTNSSTNLGFMAIGKLRAGTLTPPVPSQAVGQAKIPLQDVNSLAIYRVEALLLCNGNGCRPCDPSPVSDCPIPPPIPIGSGKYEVGVAPKGAPRH